MIIEPFSEAPYYDGYKAIRNRFRRYDSVGIISGCLHYLHEPFATPYDYTKRYPWCVMLLTKWILVDPTFFERGRRMPTPSEVRTILNMVIDLAGKVRMPSEHDYITLFIRGMVQQQVMYQRRSTIAQVARQMLYFRGLSVTHYIPRTFHEITGLPLGEFFRLALAFHTAFLSDEPRRYRIGSRWFSELQMSGDPRDVETFLELLSAPFGEIRKSLLDRDASLVKSGRQPRAASEYAEQTPLVHTPLLPSGKGDYIVIDPHLIENCLENFVYTTLRRNHVQGFMTHFGPIFEDYVRLAVEYSHLPYRSENDLKTLIGSKQDQGLIDFVIADGDAHVFVDAKAAEMNYRGNITHDAAELAKLLDASLLKAVQQANGVSAYLSAINSSDLVFKPREANYLIVVTYARTYIGNGQALAGCVGIDTIVAAARQPNGMRIPIENMYFMTIEEFESLIAQVRIGKTGLVQALEKAKMLDADPSTSSFLFEQHLSKWGMAGTAPDYLVQQTTNALRQLAADLKQSQ